MNRTQHQFTKCAACGRYACFNVARCQSILRPRIENSLDAKKAAHHYAWDSIIHGDVSPSKDGTLLFTVNGRTMSEKAYVSRYANTLLVLPVRLTVMTILWRLQALGIPFLCYEERPLTQEQKEQELLQVSLAAQEIEDNARSYPLVFLMTIRWALQSCHELLEDEEDPLWDARLFFETQPSPRDRFTMKLSQLHFTTVAETVMVTSMTTTLTGPDVDEIEWPIRTIAAKNETSGSFQWVRYAISNAYLHPDDIESALEVGASELKGEKGSKRRKVQKEEPAWLSSALA